MLNALKKIIGSDFFYFKLFIKNYKTFIKKKKKLNSLKNKINKINPFKK
jgi:hypothetical protein